MTDQKDEKRAQRKAAQEKLKSDSKQARLAEALRVNLRRRKQQSRDRTS